MDDRKRTDDPFVKVLEALSGELPYVRFDGRGLFVSLEGVGTHSTEAVLYWGDDMDDAVYRRENGCWKESGFDHEGGRDYDSLRSDDWMLDLRTTMGNNPSSRTRG